VKILVSCKRVPDTDHKIRVLPDGTDIDESNMPFVVNPFDAIALEESLRIRETINDGVEVIAVGIGPDQYEKELRTALAMGADRALLVHCDETLDPWNVAKILVAVVSREQPDLVLMGKQAVDDDANQTGQFLAALLDWPQATFASKIEFLDSAKLQVARETDAGIEKLLLQLPAVITTDLRLNEPRYASLPSIMKARKKTIDSVSYRDFDITLEPRIKVLSVEAAGSTRDCTMVSDAAELIGRLHNEAKVI
jgi:electron transfer flavoprotein beta subunit